MTTWAVPSFTVNIAWPLELVATVGELLAPAELQVLVPLMHMVEPPLAPCESLTFLPLTGWLNESLSVTVIVEVVVPSAGTATGLALTVEAEALTAPTVKFTLAVCVTARLLSVVSVAV